MTSATRSGTNQALHPKKSLVSRVIMVIACLITCWHISATFLWVAPVTPLRDLVPGTLLTNYMIPYFGQSWSVFAPEPINGNFTLRVRAMKTQPDGSTSVTDWVDATDAEQSMSTHHFFQPRAAALAWQTAFHYKNSWDALTSGQQSVTALDYFEGQDWFDRLSSALVANQSNPSATSTMISDERRIIQYSTQVALAMWGDDVIRVQYEVYRQNVTPFAKRNDPNVTPEPKQTAQTGWRGLLFAPGQSREDFASTFRAAAAGTKP